METVSFDIDTTSLIAAQKLNQQVNATSSSSSAFTTTFNAIHKAIGKEERAILSTSIECASDQDEYEDENGFLYIDESQVNSSDPSNHENGQQDEQQLQQQQVRYEDQGVQWFNFGLITRIVFGSFLLTNSFSSYTYRIGLGVLSCLYYLFETGIAAYLMKKYLNVVSFSELFFI